MINGIDVSNHQGTINWKLVGQQGYAFALMKASEGTTFADPFFRADFEGASGAGMARACYHYANPSKNDPVSEANFFLANIQGVVQQGDVVALDLEEGNGNLSVWALTFLKTVESAIGCKPLLYTSPGFMQEHGLATNELAQYGLWLAQWQTALPAPPAPWQFWAVWQDSDKGFVQGINGPVDLDVFNGTVDQFRQYGIQAPTTRTLLDSDRWQLVKYVVGGSGVTDLNQWLASFSD